MLEDVDSLMQTQCAEAPRLAVGAVPAAVKDADAAGEGAWSELPLYDGIEWDDEACALAPTLSRLLTDRGRAGSCRSSAPRRTIQRGRIFAERLWWPRYCVLAPGAEHIAALRRDQSAPDNAIRIAWLRRRHVHRWGRAAFVRRPNHAIVFDDLNDTGGMRR